MLLDSRQEVRDSPPPRPEEPLMELEEVNWRMVVVMAAAAAGSKEREERRGAHGSAAAAPRAAFIGGQVGGRGGYDRLALLFPFPWAFITPGDLPAPRWLGAPSPPTSRVLPHFSKPLRWASACECACLRSYARHL